MPNGALKKRRKGTSALGFRKRKTMYTTELSRQEMCAALGSGPLPDTSGGAPDNLSESPPVPFQGTSEYPLGLLVGLDVGSTTVKAIVVNPLSDDILWKDYRRHETKQLETCLNFLTRIEMAFSHVPKAALRSFVTGSGGAPVGQLIHARFVQEVNAVSRVVEKLFPHVQSVVELGGQDAKIIVFKTDEARGTKRKIPSMNDKCAGGTGAVIDKIAAKLQIPAEELRRMRYDGVRLFPVAGKCGVFAETDINGLQKQGVPAHELMASLFEAVVQQNLAVLARGHTLRPVVLLLGGPNYFFPGLQESWRFGLSKLWAERNVPLPAGVPLGELVLVPENAHYFGALGAVEFGKAEIEDNPNLGVYGGTERLRWYFETGRTQARKCFGLRGLVKDEAELRAFRERYRPQPWNSPAYPPGTQIDAFVGIDGGSTSTKGVLLDPNKNIIAEAYQLSKGNPIEDTQDILAELQSQIEAQGCSLRILGLATTGYARNTLKGVFGADVALVETVAHAQSGLHSYPQADVICDVGGQDIKIIILKNGAVKDFRLNTQCSAGNGFYLQATAAAFGYSVEGYADQAFSAEAMPEFGYGCAVFMQSDIVNFQRIGWQSNEIMAGLAAVLPKNIWLYVCKMPNLSLLGKTFVLQGGTQYNLAAVKAQRDFIESRFAGTGITPEIIVHQHCGESGAIGCALEALRLYVETGYRTSFVGFEAARSIRYRITRNEETRCSYCKNKCLRTFIHITSTSSLAVAQSHPPEPVERRLIVATCDKGAAEDVHEMRAIKKEWDEIMKAHPNFAAIEARDAFKPVSVACVADPLPGLGRFASRGRRTARARRRHLMARRQGVRIGIPRVLNLYSHAPFFMGYFQSLGVPADNIVWSDHTNETLFKEGVKRGSIDPCYPSKVCIAHVHNLLYHKHTAAKPLTHIFFPMMDSFPTWLTPVVASRACPTGVATPEATYAAFIKESDVFAEKGIRFKKTFVNLDGPELCGRQMYEDWADELGLTEAESIRAVREGYKALAAYGETLRRSARRVLDDLERDGRLGIVLLARPYHNDPGVNHGICEELQRRGYPIFTIESLPICPDIMKRLFGPEIDAGEFNSPFSIEDVWKNSYSENSSRKIWAAKYTARHPNLIALELSSFKCGHDAPITSTVEEIIERSGTPYFYFKEIDENKPAGSINIRVETIEYFLKRYQQRAALMRPMGTSFKPSPRTRESTPAAGMSAMPETLALAGPYRA
jgi:activator of 2-hydroxyglutaryl-CoA dehydratase/predicted nucleotide-binding protein (sugar kinase/HSP70/actin superfamily)